MKADEHTCAIPRLTFSNMINKIRSDEDDDNDNDNDILGKDDDNYESSCSCSCSSSCCNDIDIIGIGIETRRHSALSNFLADLFQEHSISIIDVDIVPDNAKQRATVPRRGVYYDYFHSKSPQQDQEKKSFIRSHSTVRWDSQEQDQDNDRLQKSRRRRSSSRNTVRTTTPVTTTATASSCAVRNDRFLSSMRLTERPKRRESLGALLTSLLSSDFQSIGAGDGGGADPYNKKKIKNQRNHHRNRHCNHHSHHDKQSVSTSTDGSASLLWEKLNSSNSYHQTSSSLPSPKRTSPSTTSSSTSTSASTSTLSPYLLQMCQHQDRFDKTDNYTNMNTNTTPTTPTRTTRTPHDRFKSLSSSVGPLPIPIRKPSIEEQPVCKELDSGSAKSLSNRKSLSATLSKIKYNDDNDGDGDTSPIPPVRKISILQLDLNKSEEQYGEESEEQHGRQNSKWTIAWG